MAIRRFSKALDEVLYALALDGEVDETAGDVGGPVWSALMREGPAVAERARDLIQSGGVDVTMSDVDPTDWSILEGSAGVVLTKDEGGILSVQPYESEVQLASAWSAVMVDLEPEEPGPPTVHPGDQSETPT